MRICIASKNPSKIAGIKLVVQQFGFLENALVEGIAVPSNVSPQPIGLQETLQGAQNRAENAFEKNALSVGLESGVLPFQQGKGGLMVVMACCVFDGKRHYFGLSSAFELPPKAVELVLNKKLELQDAVHQAGLTSNPKIGQDTGIVSVLTNARIERKELAKQAAILAFAKLEQKEKFFWHSNQKQGF